MSIDGLPSLSATQNVVIVVQNANAAPVITAPVTLTVPEDQLLPIPAITVSDSDNSILEIRLSVTNGIIFLTNISNLTFIYGEPSDTNMVFDGTLTDLTNALASITYRPNRDFNGQSKSITINRRCIIGDCLNGKG